MARQLPAAAVGRLKRATPAPEGTGVGKGQVVCKQPTYGIFQRVAEPLIRGRHHSKGVDDEPRNTADPMARPQARALH